MDNDSADDNDTDSVEQIPDDGDTDPGDSNNNDDNK